MVSHIPVLLQEVRDGLSPKKDHVVIDGTVGSGGHARALAELLSSHGVLVGIDRDAHAVRRARKELEGLECRVEVVHGNYRNIASIVRRLSLPHIDRVLLDLGMSSVQLESSGRGFSFRKDEPLLLSFDEEEPMTAQELLNTWSKEQIADVIYTYGEERFAKRIAEQVVLRREERPIETTFDLVSAVEKAVPAWYRHKRIHFATKTFQALRIAVNDEINALREGLRAAIELLSSSGRIAVISFHSLEDRMVKNMFRDSARGGVGTVVTKKAIVPQEQEIQENPRSRSAKLRIFEKQ